ncbi:MAG: NUDIX hydrolase [Nitrososphaerales archaeon]
MITIADKSIPKDKWIPAPMWKQVTRYMPMPCMDIIFQKNDGSILFGYRIIAPYMNTWSLVGGRILSGERLESSAKRIGKEYGMSFKELYLVGVFPKTFESRSDIVISVAACDLGGEAIVEGKEFSNMVWRKREPSGLGSNYHLMFSKWMKVKESKEFLRLNRIL